MRDIRVGIVGFGAMGLRHAQDTWDGRAQGMKLAAICDPSRAQLSQAQERFPGVLAFETLEAMLGAGAVDAVILAGPHSLHAPQALFAARSGIHVLTEKPVGVRASEVEKAIDAADEKGLVFNVMFNQRANPLNQRVKALLASGAIGAPRRVIQIMTNCYRPQSYFDSGAWRATWKFEGGGMLVNQCSHSMDLLSWWRGQPSRVSAHLGYGKWHDIEVDDDLSIYMEYPDGSTANFIACTADVPGVSMLEIQGDCGKIVVNRSGAGLTLYTLDTSESIFTKTFAGGLGSPEISKQEIREESEDEGHLAILRNFAGCIRGQAAPIVSARDALGSLYITQAAYLSSWLGKDVELPASNALFDAELDKRVAISKPRAVKPVKLDFAAQWRNGK